MRERGFEQSMSHRKAIEQDLADSGIESLDEWRQSFDVEEENKHSFLFDYLEIEKADSNKEKIAEFKETEDSLQRLELLSAMSLPDAIICVRDFSKTNGAYRFLDNRLEFYQKFIKGESTKEVADRAWDDKEGKYVDVLRTAIIDNYDITPESIRLGILRDIYYAAMQGTAEMGAVKVATNNINHDAEQSNKTMAEKGYDTQYVRGKIRSVVQFFGYYSGVFEEGTLGQYANICELYKKCQQEIEKKFVTRNLNEEELEHKAVLLMAERLKGGFKYNGILDNSNSPYNASFEESIAVGQLGHSVMRQLRGMRHKISGTNFENIERFIGKSGDNAYEAEKRRLYWQINNFGKLVAGDAEVLRQPHLEDFAYKLVDLEKDLENGSITQEEFDASKAELDAWFERHGTNFLERENQFKLRQQDNWFQYESERLTQKFTRDKALIEEEMLPGDDRDLRLQRAKIRYDDFLGEARKDYDAQVAYFRNRTPEQLLADLEKRQVLIDERYEKRKSLAQKALDLHFAFNHTAGDYEGKPLAGIVDWINCAPFGTIKRAHKMWRQGIEEESVVACALTDMISGARGMTREDYNIVQEIIEKVKNGDRAESGKIERMGTIGSVVRPFGYELTFSEIAELTDEKFIGLNEALKIYDLNEVKQFGSQGINLRLAMSAQEITRKHGYELLPAEVIDLVQYSKSWMEILGLDEALNLLGLPDIKILLSRNVELGNAVAVLEAAKKFNYEISIERIAVASKSGGELFSKALDSLPLATVEQMLDENINLHSYFDLKTILETKGFSKPHQDLVLWVGKLEKLQEPIGNLAYVLDNYGIDGTEKIVNAGFKLSEILEVLNTLKEDRIIKEEALKVTLAAVGRDRNSCVQAIENNRFSFKVLIWLSEKFTPPLDPAAHEAVNIFGEQMLTADQYQSLKRLFDGEITPEMSALGIVKTGKEGAAQLREKIGELRRGLLTDEVDIKLIQDNPILNGIVKTLVRFDQSSWRGNRRQKFNDVLAGYRANKDSIEPLPEYMAPSKVGRINTVDRRQNFEFSESFLARFNYLQIQLREAFGLFRQSKSPFSDLTEKAQVVIDNTIQELEQKKSQIDKLEAQKGMQMRIDALKNLDIRSVKKFQDTIRILSQFSELKDLLLQTVFVASLRKNKAYRERVEDQILNNDPNVDSMSFMLDFIDHVTNKETLKHYFTDKQSYRAFNGIVDVKAIEEELARIQNQETIGTVPIQFVPSRNLLTEFSGDIADTCWTGKYDSMLKKYPNFSSITFVQDPGGANERYVGAALLIETESNTGEKLLVVRGLNPLENTINRLSVSDFFNKFMSWVKETADKDSRKVALVVGTTSGGSGTNRPVLFQHMNSLPKEPVILASSDDTEFNGYNIVNSCIKIK